MTIRRSTVPIAAAVILSLVLLGGWRSTPTQGVVSSPFVVGASWHAPSGLQCTIEEVQGDWVRVTTNTALPGFPPSAIWIYAPMGQIWTID